MLKIVQQEDDEIVVENDTSEESMCIEDAELIDFDEEAYQLLDVTTPEYVARDSKWVLPRLYKYERNKKSTWRIGWCEEESCIVTIWGYDIKQIKKRTIADNTLMSASDRAFPICCTKFLKQQRAKGYHTANTRPDTTMKPMRGYEYHEGRVVRGGRRSYKSKPLIDEDYPVVIQPKLDGIRCITRCLNGRVILRSRTNKAFTNKMRIRKELARLHFYLPSGTEIDGEFYMHGLSLQDIMSIVTTTKTKHEREDELSFHVFDCLTSNTQFLERWHMLRRAFIEAEKDEKFEVLKLIEIVTCYGKEHLDELFREYVAMNYEGVMIRFCSDIRDTTSTKYLRSLYVEDKCHNILKYKVVSDEEGRIVGIETRETGEMVFVVTNDDNVTFSLSMAASHDERKHAVYLLSNVGKLLTYEYRGKTKALVPKHAVGKCIRHDGI